MERPHRETEPFDGVGEEPPPGGRERGDGFEIGGGEVGVAEPRQGRAPRCRSRSRLRDPLADLRGAFRGAGLEVAPRDGGDRDVQVDPVEQRSRELAGVAAEIGAVAPAGASRVSPKAAGTWQRSLFATTTLRAPKPLPPAYPRQLRRLGDHLRNRRLERRLLQREVAAELGVTESTVYHWETGKTVPQIRFMPALIRFLGGDPRPLPASFPERLRAARTARGLSVEAFARLLGIDPSTVARWETGKGRPGRKLLALLAQVLEGRGAS